MSSSSLFTILENIQESIALAVDMAKNQRENETGESSYIPLEFHLKNNHHQSNLAEKNQVKESIHDLQRENENMRKINLTLKKKIIDFEKSNQLISYHILQNKVQNLTKSNNKLKKEKIQQTKQLTAVNSKMITLKMQMERMKCEIIEIKRNIKKKMKKNIVAVKSENLNPEDYNFENDKVKTEEVQLLMTEIKTEHD